mgnify:CR=1 FL=1
MERTEWLARRRQGIGGSDVAAILGLSPWRTALDVYHDKTGAEKPEAETENMRIGTALEQFVADRFTEETGRRTSKFNALLKRQHRLMTAKLAHVRNEAVAHTHFGIKTKTDLRLCAIITLHGTVERNASFLTQIFHAL